MHRPATRTGFRRALCRRIGLAAIALSLATAALAQEEAEDDDLSFEQKIIKGLLGGMGVDTGRSGIDYRERSPLVIPPAMNLPTPEQTNNATHPAWPKDADIQERKKARVDNRVRPRTLSELQDPGRPLSPQELQQGRGSGQRVTEPGQSGPRSESEIGRPLSPSELGYTGGIFSSLFGSSKSEEVPFKGEPERRTLTQPPPGYQTPSPSQPYGVGTDKSTGGWKIPTLWDRGTTSN